MGAKNIEVNWRISAIPKDLRKFSIDDIDTAFDTMEREFRLNSKWRQEFKEQLKTIGSTLSAQEFFFRFCACQIDPALKTLLWRQDSVVESMCRWIVSNRRQISLNQPRHSGEQDSGGQRA